MAFLAFFRALILWSIRGLFFGKSRWNCQIRVETQSKPLWFLWKEFWHRVFLRAFPLCTEWGFSHTWFLQGICSIPSIDFCQQYEKFILQFLTEFSQTIQSPQDTYHNTTKLWLFSVLYLIFIKFWTSFLFLFFNSFSYFQKYCYNFFNKYGDFFVILHHSVRLLKSILIIRSETFLNDLISKIIIKSTHRSVSITNPVCTATCSRSLCGFLELRFVQLWLLLRHLNILFSILLLTAQCPLIFSEWLFFWCFFCFYNRRRQASCLKEIFQQKMANYYQELPKVLDVVNQRLCFMMLHGF